MTSVVYRHLQRISVDRGRPFQFRQFAAWQFIQQHSAESKELVFALKLRLQLTSGEETRKFFFPPGSSENSMVEPAARRLSASSTTFEKLSLSITTSEGGIFFLKFLATSPSGISFASSCALTHDGKVGTSIPTNNRASHNRVDISVRTRDLKDVNHHAMRKSAVVWNGEIAVNHCELTPFLPRL